MVAAPSTALAKLVAKNDAVSVAAGGSVVVKPARNDTGEGKLTVTRIGKPSHGTAVLSSDGTVTYAPAKGCAGGADLFTYTVRSSKGGTDTATVTLTVDEAPAVSQPAASRLPKTGTDITSAAGADILALLVGAALCVFGLRGGIPLGDPVVAGGVPRRRGPGRHRPGRHRDDHHRRCPFARKLATSCNPAPFAAPLYRDEGSAL